MTELRDARLRRALDEAPDAQLRPLPRTRDAVLAAARAGAETRPSWWRRLWGAPAGASRMPWNSALATVLVAGLVTVLWQGQEVPPAQPEAVAESAKAAATAQATGRAAVTEKKEAPEAAGPARPAPSAAPRARAPQPVPAAPKAAAPSEPAPAELAKQAERTQEQAAPLQDRAAVAAAAPPPVVSAPASPPAPAAAGLRAARPEAFMPPRWTQLRLEGAGKVVEIGRGDSVRLTQDIERLAATPDSMPFTDQVELRVRLLEEGRVAGTLVLGRSQAGWLLGDGPGTVRGLPADPFLVQGVRNELERLLVR